MSKKHFPGILSTLVVFLLLLISGNILAQTRTTSTNTGGNTQGGNQNPGNGKSNRPKKSNSEKGKDLRVFYDYQSQMLLNSKNDGNTKELEAPLRRSAGRDIVIEVFNFNPLKEQVSSESSATDLFLADTGLLAKKILIPAIENTPEGDKAKEEAIQQDTLNGLDNENLQPTGRFAIHNNRRSVNSCESIKGFMGSVDVLKTKMEASIRVYKSFISEIDVIKNDYEFLKLEQSLEGTIVSDRLEQSFLTGLNNFLTAQGLSTLGSSARFLRTDRITDIEGSFYRSITAYNQTLDELSKEVDKLRGGCDGFLELYKKATGKIEEIRKALKEFDNTRNDKILPGFKDNLTLYNKLRSYIGKSPSLPIRVTVENDIHTVTIFSKAVGADAKTEHSKIKIEPVRGWKLDVAGGVFVGGVSDYKFAKKTIDSIYTKKYVVGGVVRDTTVQDKFTAIYKEKQSPLSYGGMIFLHAHSQNPSKINGGLYLGFGALFNDQSKWAGAFGGSLMIGKKQRFNINPGILFSQVDRLSKTHNTDTWYPGVIDNIPIYKSWQLGWVLGISWNIK